MVILVSFYCMCPLSNWSRLGYQDRLHPSPMEIYAIDLAKNILFWLNCFCAILLKMFVTFLFRILCMSFAKDYRIKTRCLSHHFNMLIQFLFVTTCAKHSGKCVRIQDEGFTLTLPLPETPKVMSIYECTTKRYWFLYTSKS